MPQPMTAVCGHVWEWWCFGFWRCKGTHKKDHQFWPMGCATEPEALYPFNNSGPWSQWNVMLTCTEHAMESLYHKLNRATALHAQKLLQRPRWPKVQHLTIYKPLRFDYFVNNLKLISDGQLAKLSPSGVNLELRRALRRNGKTRYRRPTLDSPPSRDAMSPFFKAS